MARRFFFNKAQRVQENSGFSRQKLSRFVTLTFTDNIDTSISLYTFTARLLECQNRSRWFLKRGNQCFLPWPTFQMSVQVQHSFCCNEKLGWEVIPEQVESSILNWPEGHPSSERFRLISKCFQVYSCTKNLKLKKRCEVVRKSPTQLSTEQDSRIILRIKS